MNGTIDRVEVGEVLTRREAIGILEVVVVEIDPSPPATWWSRRQAADPMSEFDDIPSVVRALLVGYDEV